MVDGVTIMVSRNLSRYTEAAPPNDMSRRHKIVGGPLYPVAELTALLRHQCVQVATAQARRDIADLALDAEEVSILVSDALRSGRYKDSEWCLLNGQDCWAACDSYVLMRQEWNDVVGRDLPVEYFVKIAIARTGVVVLVVSCHL